MEILDLIILLLLIGGGIYFRNYLSEKAKRLATREEFDELLKQLKINTRATEEIKQTIQRAQIAKSKGSDSIIQKMAQIETHLLSWSILIYFRSDELASNEPIEELGRRDLKKVAQYVLELNRLISQFTIYFSADLMHSIHEWSRDVYNLIYEYDAIYRTSLNHHKDKNAEDKDKVAWIDALINSEIKPKQNKLGDKKHLINQRLIKELELATDKS